MLHLFRNARKNTPIDLNKPDAAAVVTNLRSSQAPFGKNYRGCCAIKEGYRTSVCFQTMDGCEMLHEQPHRCHVNFLTPEAYPYTLWVGRKLELYEGERLVGTMEILEIRNPLLDRSTRYTDRDGLLEDRKILNLALKCSLKWGKEFNEPMDNKLMKKLPRLSGRDIDTVCQYVLQARDDVIWNIIIPRWDSKRQCVDNAAEAVIVEKYPWLNKNNLGTLWFQGSYYAWH